MRTRWALVCGLVVALASAGSHAQSARVALSANTTFHVAPDGADSPSCGSGGGPCATLDYLVNRILTEIDPLDKAVTISVAPGTYQGFTVRAPLLGGGTLTIQGSTGAVIAGLGRNGVTVMNGARVQLNDLILSGRGSGNYRAVFATLNSFVTLGPNITLDRTSGEHLAVAYHSTLSVTQSYSVIGGATTHGHAFSHSTLSISPGVTISFQGTPAFSAYLFGASQSEILISGVSMNGAVSTPGVTGCMIHFSSLLYKPGTVLPAGTGVCQPSDASSNIVD